MVRAFLAACVANRVDEARRLADEVGLVEADAALPLKAACAGGCPDVLRWLTARLEYAPNGPRVITLFRHVCRGGDRATAMQLADQFGINAGVVRADNNAALQAACAVGHLEFVWWLAGRFGLTAADARACRALYTACANGCLSVAMWLTDRFGLVPADTAGALDAACSNGHLRVATWLASWLDVRSSLGSTDVDALLVTACGHGHLGVARWLACRYGADGRAFDNAALRAACGRGHLGVVGWLVGRYSLTDADVRADVNAALHVACGHGHLHVVQWLADAFGLEADDFHRRPAARCSAADMAHRHGRQDVVQWIAACFGECPPPEPAC